MNNIENIKDVISSLCSGPGISGYETPTAEAIRKQWEDLTDEITFSPLGNLYARRKADDPIASPNRTILLAAHMDGIGMIVSEIVGEFIRFAPIGGFDPRILPGQFVNIHGRGGDIRGLIVMPGSNLTKEDYGRNPIPIIELLIDTGYDADELKSRVRVGDIISFANDPVCMEDNTISAHSLDNRASIAALTVCLRELKTMRTRWDVCAVGTVQEEETMAGGATAPYDLRPDIAVAVDVTFAKGPGSKDWNTRPLGSGPSLGFGMNVHPAIHEMCKEICRQENIEYTVELYPRMSGTDAYAMQVTAQGIPCMVISIPLRYMHTANEIISMKDVENVGKLLAHLIRSLDETTMNRLIWED